MSLENPDLAGEYTDKSSAEILAEATGRPVEEFQFDREKHSIPELDELEWVDPDEIDD